MKPTLPPASPTNISSRWCQCIRPSIHPFHHSIWPPTRFSYLKYGRIVDSPSSTLHTSVPLAFRSSPFLSLIYSASKSHLSLIPSVLGPFCPSSLSCITLFVIILPSFDHFVIVSSVSKALLFLMPSVLRPFCPGSFRPSTFLSSFLPFLAFLSHSFRPSTFSSSFLHPRLFPLFAPRSFVLFALALFQFRPQPFLHYWVCR